MNKILKLVLLLLVFMVYANGQVIKTYNKRLNLSLISPDFGFFGTPLASGTVTSVATLDINMSSYYTAYKQIWVSFTGFRPVTAGDDLWLRVSTDGVTYDASSGNYEWAVNYVVPNNGAAGNNLSNSDTKIVLTQSVTATTGGGTSGVVMLFNQGSSVHLKVRGIASTDGNSPDMALIKHDFSGERNTAQATPYVRLMFSTSNIATGSYAVYGMQ